MKLSLLSQKISEYISQYGDRDCFGRICFQDEDLRFYLSPSKIEGDSIELSGPKLFVISTLQVMSMNITDLVEIGHALYDFSERQVKEAALSLKYDGIIITDSRWFLSIGDLSSLNCDASIPLP